MSLTFIFRNNACGRVSYVCMKCACSIIRPCWRKTMPTCFSSHLPYTERPEGMEKELGVGYHETRASNWGLKTEIYQLEPYSYRVRVCSCPRVNTNSHMWRKHVPYQRKKEWNMKRNRVGGSFCMHVACHISCQRFKLRSSYNVRGWSCSSLCQTSHVTLRDLSRAGSTQGMCKGRLPALTTNKFSSTTD